ncbi:YhcH/YjgK/YiaL family protein [Mucilaginibacter sp. UR6-11]|uniref:YhcH/YjgK/YiaL family protein n=1 Tax=Mucilaginibacter sp. UR6-11 TaxID=1435644 RepID=UPI001E2B0C32|nr:YhcH/YjgK/YiaL family protein [Mucilaginibacter sp. UR6-11]MCC8423451.1 YhcH/YjgK/YiaL family protein [Mucilaginibacter sp. UR6-11]
MIIDTLTNAGQYYGLHKNFKTAFEYLNSTELTGLADGVIEIADGVKVIVSNNDTRTAEVAVKTFECHNQNIDIQVLIRGNEAMGWKPRKDCKNVVSPYSAEKDYMFFHEQADTFFSLQEGQFVIFFPEDVHAPLIGDGVIKKLVVKIRID